MTPLTPTFRLAAVVLFALYIAAPARADWTGKLQVRVEPKGKGRDADQDGRICGRGAKLRIDIDQGQMGKMATVLNLTAHQATMIMEARHAFMTIDMDRSQGRSMLAGIHCQTRSTEKTVTLDVLDFKEESVPADRFEVPAGYTDMSSRGPMGPQVPGR
jgi:hypothetical protein